MSHTPFLLRPQQALSLFSGLAHSHTSKRGAPHLAQHIVAVEYASGSQEVHAQGASTRSRQRAKQATSTSELTGRAHRQKAPDASNLQRQHDHPYATATPKQSTKHTQHRRKGRDPWYDQYMHHSYCSLALIPCDVCVSGLDLIQSSRARELP